MAEEAARAFFASVTFTRAALTRRTEISMQHFIRGHEGSITPPRLSVIDGGAAVTRRDDLSLDQTLEQCLLETQRQVHRLEEIVHRLTFATSASGAPTIGALSLIQEGNRRLRQEVDEFALDSQAVVSMNRLPSPASRRTPLAR